MSAGTLTRLRVLIRHDVRLQTRYRIYAAYGFLAVFYIAGLFFAAPLLPDWAYAIIVYTDPSVLGFFFLGGLMLLEKGEGVRLALGTSPVTATEYLASKSLTLTVLALIVTAIFGVMRGPGVHWPLYVLTVALTSIHFIGLGAFFVTKFRTVTGYIMGTAVILTPVILPAGAAFLDPMPWAAAVIPAAAQFKLMLVSLTGEVTAPALTLGLLVSALAWAGAGFTLGVRALRAEFGGS